MRSILCSTLSNRGSQEQKEQMQSICSFCSYFYCNIRRTRVCVELLASTYIPSTQTHGSLSPMQIVRRTFCRGATKKPNAIALGFFERCVPQAERDVSFGSDVRSAREVCLRHENRNTSLHCEHSEQHHYAKHNITLAKPKLN